MIISILRITSLQSVSYADITNTSAGALLWSFMEPAIGITVACGPLMRPLLDKSPLLFGRRSRTTPGRYGDTSSFERLEETGHSLNQVARPNASVVTSCARGDGRWDLKEEEEDKDGRETRGEDAGAGTVKVFRGITVKKEFHTQGG